MRLKSCCWMLAVIGMFISIQLRAQSTVQGLKISMKDTVDANKESSTITTNIRMENAGRDTIAISLSAGITPGWRLLSSKVPELRLAPGSSKIVPIALIKQQQQITTRFSALFLRMKTAGAPDRFDTVTIRNSILTKFSFRNPGSEAVYFVGNATSQQISSKLSNDGNLPMKYRVKYNLSQPIITDELVVTLKPHTDTVLDYRISIPYQFVSGLQNEVLQVFVKDDSSNATSLNYYLSATNSRVFVNRTDRVTSPLRLEVGMLNRTNSRYVFGNIEGMLNLGKSRQLAFGYRTEDYSNANVPQRNIFRVNYTSNRLNLYAGQAIQRTDFFTFGNQASIGVKIGNSTRASVWYLRPFENSLYRNYYNNQEQAGASLAYGSPKLIVEHQYNNTLDSAQRPMSGIFSNRIKYRGGKIFSGEVFVGLGVDSMSSLARSNYADVIGLSYGGTAMLNYKRISFSGSTLKNSLNYPGVYRGLEQISASVSVALSKRVSFTPFYSSNRTTNNFGMDTLLNSNLTRINMKRLGLRTGLSLKNQMINLSVGRYEDLRRQDMPVYKYADVNWSLQLPKASISVSSENGIAPSLIDKNSQVWFNTSNVAISCYNFEIGGMYYRFPSYTQDERGNNAILNTETMNFVLGYQVRIRENFTAFLNYDLAKFAVNDVVTHNVAGNMSYSSPVNGLTLRLSGSVPLLQTGDDRADYLAGRNFVQMSVAKVFNVPTSRKKLYHDLKLRLYYDDNSNGRRDPEESALSEQYVFINERVFITDKDGRIQLRNTKPGNYSVDLSKVHAKPGKIPAYGYGQSIALDDDVNLELAFKTGKLIKGAITAVTDNNSTTLPELGGIKVTVSDSVRTLGHAFTNSDGTYSFNAPAGKYSVSLNPAAFNDKLKPRQLSFVVNVTQVDSATVDFVLIQKKREMRVMETGKSLSVAQPILPAPNQPAKDKKSQKTKAPEVKPTAAKPVIPVVQPKNGQRKVDSSRIVPVLKVPLEATPQTDTNGVFGELPTIELPDQTPESLSEGKQPHTYQSGHRSRHPRKHTPPAPARSFKNCKPHFGGGQ